jgi:photosystem II stability/assembly factor-like uncharacterized protein
MRLIALVLSIASIAWPANKLAFVRQIPGVASDSVAGLARDAEGNVYVAGSTNSFDLPATVIQTRRGGSSIYLVRADKAEGLVPPSPNGLQCLEADQRRPGRVFAFFGTESFRSDDAGERWVRTGPELPSDYCLDLTIDPFSPETVYVTFLDRGLWISRDGGRTFAEKQRRINTVRPDPFQPGVLLGVSTYGPTLRSTDAGETWATTANEFHSMRFDPGRRGIVVASGKHQGSEGLWRSADGGQTWTALGTVKDLSNSWNEFAFDAARPGTVYLANQYTLYRSDNDGRDWREVRVVAWISALTIDPYSGRIYIFENDRVFTSSDSGTTWTRVGPAGYQPIRRIALAPDPSNPTGPAILLIGRENDRDGYIAKYSPAGELLWATFLGGAAHDDIAAITVDRSGSVYVTGSTFSEDFPNARSTLPPGNIGRIFIAKLRRDGAGFEYLSLVADMAHVVAAIFVDARGAVCIVGDSSYYPGTTAAKDDLRGIFSIPFRYPWLLRLSPDGTEREVDRRAEVPGAFQGVAVDGEGNIWAAGGRLYKFDRFGTPQGIVPALDQGIGFAITVDRSGLLHITGRTQSRNFPVTSRALITEVPHFDPPVSTGFVAGIDPRTSTIVYSTFLSGESTDSPYALAVDALGRPVVAGETWSKAFPLRESLQGNFSAETSGFITRLTPDGSALAGLSTFVGDDRRFTVRGVVAGDDGSIYFAGHTLLSRSDIAIDAFLAKIEPQPPTTDLRLDAVLNAASRTASAVAPGSLVSLPGDNFRDDARAFFDEIEAGIVHRNWRELLVRVPEGIGEVVTVRVASEGAESQRIVMPTVRVAPGIYTVDRLGYDLALAWNEDGSRNGRDNPAVVGSVVTIAVNGLRDDIPFTVHANTYSFPPNPLEVLSVQRGQPEELDGDTHLVRVRLPSRMPDYGPMMLYIVSDGLVSRSVPLYATDRRQ